MRNRIRKILTCSFAVALMITMIPAQMLYAEELDASEELVLEEEMENELATAHELCSGHCKDCARLLTYEDEEVEISSDKTNKGEYYFEIFESGENLFTLKLQDIQCDGEELWVYLRDTSGKILSSYSTKSSEFSVDLKLESEITYYLSVRGSDGAHFSANANFSYKLAAPVCHTGEVKTDGIRLSWDSVAGAEKYRIRREEILNHEWERVDSIVGTTTGTSILDKKVQSGKLYVYYVTCVTADGAVQTSSEATAGIYHYFDRVVVTVSNGRNGVDITWNKVGKVSGYYVYRKSANESYTKIASLGGTASSYTDQKAVSGKTYTYAVCAYQPRFYDTENSRPDKSSYKSATITCLRPTTLTLANRTSDILLKWTKIPGATGYYIYRKKAAGSFEKIAIIKDGSKVSYKDQTVASKKGIKYTYAVRPYCGKTVARIIPKAIVR